MIINVVQFLIFKNLLYTTSCQKRSAFHECYRVSDLENSLEESTREMNHMDPHNAQEWLTLRMTYNKQRVFSRALNYVPFVMD